jgi:hypothetical protein
MKKKISDFVFYFFVGACYALLFIFAYNYLF